MPEKNIWMWYLKVTSWYLWTTISGCSWATKLWSIVRYCNHIERSYTYTNIILANKNMLPWLPAKQPSKTYKYIKIIKPSYLLVNLPKPLWLSKHAVKTIRLWACGWRGRPPHRHHVPINWFLPLRSVPHRPEAGPHLPGVFGGGPWRKFWWDEHIRNNAAAIYKLHLTNYINTSSTFRLFQIDGSLHY